MAKTLMYRLFGLGRIPKQAMAILETEGIVYQEEEIPASISFRNFRSPSRRSGYRRNWFSGSIVITKLHFLAFAGTKTMIGLSWDDEKLGALSCTMDDKSRLRIDYDASTFNDDWSGDIELCYRSDDTATILGIIKDKQNKLR